MVEHISNKSKLLTSWPNIKKVWSNATQDVMGLNKDFLPSQHDECMWTQTQPCIMLI